MKTIGHTLIDDDEDEEEGDDGKDRTTLRVEMSHGTSKQGAAKGVLACAVVVCA